MPQPELSPNVLALDGPFEHRLIHTRGTRLHIAEAGEPTAPLLLLIHDAWSGWYLFRSILAPLADAGWHAVAVDLRGFGLSDRPPNRLGYSMEGAVSDITGLSQALGYDHASIIGVGTGASVGWALAAHTPERVTQLMACGVLPPELERRRQWTKPRVLLGDLVSRVPQWVIQRMHGQVTRRYLQWFAHHYADAFVEKTVLEESLELRRKSLGMKYAYRAVAYTYRFRTARLPKSWKDEVPTCPAVYIKPPHSSMPGETATIFPTRVGKIQIDTADPLLAEAHPDAFLGLVAQYLNLTQD